MSTPGMKQVHIDLSLMRLRLARASGGAVGLGTSSGSTVGLAVGGTIRLAVGRCANEVGDGGLAHAAKRLASSRLAALLVSSKVEGDEENQVGAENSHARESGEFLTSASTGVGHPLEVGRGEVGVRGEVNEAWAQDG